MFIRDFTTNELIDFLKPELNDDELETLEKENKRKITVDDNNVKIDCSTRLNNTLTIFSIKKREILLSLMLLAMNTHDHLLLTI